MLPVFCIKCVRIFSMKLIQGILIEMQPFQFQIASNALHLFFGFIQLFALIGSDLKLWAFLYHFEGKQQNVSVIILLSILIIKSMLDVTTHFSWQRSTKAWNSDEEKARIQFIMSQISRLTICLSILIHKAPWWEEN